MALKHKYNSETEIPEALKPFYVAQNGAWILETDLNEELARGSAAIAERNRLQEEQEILRRQLAKVQIDNVVVTEATKRGLRSTAVPDILARAHSTIVLKEGTPEVLATDGKAPRLNKANAPMSVTEWVEEECANAPHLFEANRGTGSGGNPSRQEVIERPEQNPYKRETWNLTQQVLLQKRAPEVAKQLKMEAGL